MKIDLLNETLRILSLILIASIFIVPVTADIPIKLKLTTQSYIYSGDTTDIIVMLLDENNNPAMDESDISVNISTNLGQVSSPLIIYAGKNTSVTKFTSKVPGIAVISVRSRGLIGDSVSIEVSPEVMPSSTVNETIPTPTSTRMEPGFEGIFAIAGLLAVVFLILRKEKTK